MKAVYNVAEDPSWAKLETDAVIRSDGYSRTVALLKRILPGVGAALLLLVAAWPRIALLIDNVSPKGLIDLRDARELTMVHPRYAGSDRFDRPYVITAAVGRQLPNRSDLMSLDQPHAVTIAHSGAKIVLSAATGVYQAQPQLLDLFDNVTLTHQNGTRFVTRQAHANLASNTAEGHVPIEGHGPSGDIWGQGFRVFNRGDTIVFTGRSRAILRGTKASNTPAAPPEPPSKILGEAEAIETAAKGSVAPAGLAPPPASSAGIAAPWARQPPRSSRPGTARHNPARTQHARNHTAKRLATTKAAVESDGRHVD